MRNIPAKVPDNGKLGAQAPQLTVDLGDMIVHLRLLTEVVWESVGWDVEKVNEYASFFEQKRIKKEPFLQKEGKAVCVWRGRRGSNR